MTFMTCHMVTPLHDNLSHGDLSYGNLSHELLIVTQLHYTCRLDGSRTRRVFLLLTLVLLVTFVAVDIKCSS